MAYRFEKELHHRDLQVTCEAGGLGVKYLLQVGPRTAMELCAMRECNIKVNNSRGACLQGKSVFADVDTLANVVMTYNPDRKWASAYNAALASLRDGAQAALRVTEALRGNDSFKPALAAVLQQYTDEPWYMHVAEGLMPTDADFDSWACAVADRDAERRAAEAAVDKPKAGK